jgi:hypothetical protein
MQSAVHVYLGGAEGGLVYFMTAWQTWVAVELAAVFRVFGG